MKLQHKSGFNPFSIILYIGFLFSFILPISTKISNILIITFIVGVAGLVLKRTLKFQNASLAILKYSTLILIVTCVLSMLYHGEFLTVLNVLGRRISYLLIPLSLLFFTTSQLLSLKKYSLLGIIYGSIVASLILLSNNFISYYATRPLFLIDNELLNFYYTGFNFTFLFDIHPSYFGMYLLLSVSALLFGKLKIPKTLRLFIVFLFFITILFLSSRIIIFLFFIIILVSILKSLLISYGKSRMAILSFVTVVSIMCFFTYLLIKDTYIYTSLTKETAWELSFNVNEKYNSNTMGDSRVARWDVALDLIKEHPIIGYGVGMEKDALEMGFRNQGMDISARYRYDAHNLFLGYTLETGILGLVILLYYLCVNFFFFFRYKDVMFLLFLFSVLGMCLIENYLNNNAAITFIAFFGNLFLFESQIIKFNMKNELS